MNARKKKIIIVTVCIGICLIVTAAFFGVHSFIFRDRLELSYVSHFGNSDNYYTGHPNGGLQRIGLISDIPLPTYAETGNNEATIVVSGKVKRLKIFYEDTLGVFMPYVSYELEVDELLETNF